MRKGKKKFMAIEILKLLLGLVSTLYVVIFSQLQKLIIGLDTNVFCITCLIIFYIIVGIVVVKHKKA